VKQLSGQDASFLYLDSRGAHLNLTGLYIYQQPASPGQAIAYAQIFQHVESRLATVSMFRQKLVRLPLNLDHPYWVDDPDFDLESHIHLYDGPVPRSQRQLYDAVTDIHVKELDLSRPPWEMYIFEKLGQIKNLPKNCFAIVAKYHHASIDGASGSNLIDGLHDNRPLEISREADHSWQPGIRPGMIKLLANAAINNILLPMQLAKSLAVAVPGMLQSTLSGSKSDSTGPVPETRFNESFSEKRVIDTQSFELSMIKAIRQAVPGATVNDVILTICGGALRLFLEARDELPDESLVAMVPVNLRSMQEKDLAGNKVGAIFIPIHTDIANPFVRLRTIQSATHRAKSSRKGVSAEDIGEITRHIPALPLAAAARLITGLGLGHRLRPLCNCTITNVPGPKNTIYLGPAKMVHTFGVGPIIDGMGLIISIFTYRGEVTFSFTSSPRMLPDPEIITRCTAEAFNLLRKAAKKAVQNRE
jgi:WS/DGAT/MGAT family acyltransferase